jgi:hypothetical protein
VAKRAVLALQTVTDEGSLSQPILLVRDTFVCVCKKGKQVYVYIEKFDRERFD